MGFGWNQDLFAEYHAESLEYITRALCLGDSKSGAQDQVLFPGTADVVNLAVTPDVGVTPGAYMVRPWARSFWMQDQPGDAPFQSIGCYSDGYRFIGQTGASSVYSNHALAPSTAYGDAATIGESQSSDALDIAEIVRPLSAWPSNGTTGVVGVKGHSVEVIYRCAWVQVKNEAQWFSNPAKYAHLHQYVPGYGTGTRRNFSRFELLYHRRNIPTGGTGTEYSAGQVPFGFQIYNGSAATIAETSMGSGIYTIQNDAGFVPSNWTLEAESIPIGSDYSLQLATIEPSVEAHGLGLTITGGNHNNKQHARGLAALGLTALYEGADRGSLIARFTRSGMQSGSLNHASYDGSASDPQRRYLELCAPSDLFLTWGTNDVGAAVLAATFASNIMTFVQRVHVYMPLLRIHVMLPYPGNGGGATSSTMLGYCQALYAQAEAVGDRRMALYDQYSVGITLPSSAYDTTHLNPDQSGVEPMVEYLRHESGVGARRYRLHRRPTSARRGMIVVPRRVDS